MRREQVGTSFGNFSVVSDDGGPEVHVICACGRWDGKVKRGILRNNCTGCAECKVERDRRQAREYYTRKMRQLASTAKRAPRILSSSLVPGVEIAGYSILRVLDGASRMEVRCLQCGDVMERSASNLRHQRGLGCRDCSSPERTGRRTVPCQCGGVVFEGGDASHVCDKPLKAEDFGGRKDDPFESW